MPGTQGEIAQQPVLVSEPIVTLEDAMRSDPDLAVIRNARLTTGKQATVMPKWGPKLIDELMRKRHGTPFEAAVFTYHVQCSLAVAREWFRHRIGSYNEVSLRVSEASPVFHCPHRDQARNDTGRYEYGLIDDAAFDEGLVWYTGLIDDAWKAYRQLIALGWSRELARLVLPMALHTRFAWTVNARALMNFISLRTAPEALEEIRDAAFEVERLWMQAMPITHGAFDRHGRIAP